MPPWALDELFAWRLPFVARATRAPARSAETAAASPEAPLPITSTSKGTAAVMEPTLPNSPNATHQARLSPDRRQELLDLACGRRSRVALVALPGRRHLGYGAQPVLGHAEVPEALEAAEASQLLHLPRRIAGRADRRAEALHRLGYDAGVVAE